MVRKSSFFTVLMLAVVLSAGNSWGDGILFARLDFQTWQWSDGSHNYGANCSFTWSAANNVQSASLATPSKTVFKLRGGNGYFQYFRTFDTFDDLVSVFPPGNYVLQMSGKSYGKLQFNIKTPQLPPYITFLSPENDEVNVSRNLTVSWEAVPGGTYEIHLYYDKPWWSEIYSIYLGGDVSSFTVPQDVLDPHTWYQAEIRLWVPNCDNISSTFVRFKTGQ